jgi:tetratricopeptide (TPR) repeat protein
MVHDIRGLALSGATVVSLPHFEAAVRQLSLYIDDPIATVDQALAENPEFVMAHALRAWLHLIGTEPAGMQIARASLAAAQKLPATDREQGHLTAISHLVEGRWWAASRVLEDISIEYPHDLLALQIGHQTDFFRGDARMLRDRIARALPAWRADLPGYHAVLGMQAFGLEETGQYAAAEKTGRRAIELEPRDGWAQHAVAHVMEMQGRPREGIAWMQKNIAGLAQNSFLAVHNWWHLALYHLDLGEIEEALALFDGPIYGTRSRIILELIDACALLWRLHLRGLDVGDRWQPLIEAWEPVTDASSYAFNDVHAMMAFVGGQRPDLVRRLLQAQDAAMAAPGDNATFTREVGRPVALALKAFGDGCYAECLQRLRSVRNVAQRFGGSHAQRDLIDLTLIEAALRAGEGRLARALASERTHLKPTSTFNWRLTARAQSLLGEERNAGQSAAWSAAIAAAAEGPRMREAA